MGRPQMYVGLAYALHHRSKYRLQTQGESIWVETTAGMKLAPTLFSFLTGRLFSSLADAFGLDSVISFLTGYADDLTLRRTIRSVTDLIRPEGHTWSIAGLLEEVRRHSLVVSHTRAASIIKKHSCWVFDAKGNKVKGWRLGLGPNKVFPAFQRVATAKYLGHHFLRALRNFEMQTLQHRMQEAKQKLHLVRKYVYNRRVASTKSMSDTGLTPESARALRSWHAHKVRSVLSRPARISRVTTSDLFVLRKIKDPVDQVLARAFKRLKKMETKALRRPDITTHMMVMHCLHAKIASFRRKRTRARIVESLSRPLTDCICTGPSSTRKPCLGLFLLSLTDEGTRSTVSRNAPHAASLSSNRSACEITCFLEPAFSRNN